MVRYSPDGGFLAAGQTDGSIKVFAIWLSLHNGVVDVNGAIGAAGVSW